MSIRKIDPHHFRVDLNEENLAYLTKLISETLINELKESCEPAEMLTFAKVQDRMRVIQLKKQHIISDQINAACKNALEKTPTKCNRANLFGRALVEKIIQFPETKPEWLEWFKKNFLKKFLDQVRISMGVQNFDYFNELLDTALQKECMIRDLKQARIDWSAFFSHRRLALMLQKARNLRHWVCKGENQNLFIQEMNSNTPNSIRPFASRDLWQVLDAWEYDEEEKV